MKQRILWFPVILFTLLALASCRKDNKICDDKCVYGDCVEGDCVCDNGYEGLWCADRIPVSGTSSGGTSSGGTSSGGTSSGGGSLCTNTCPYAYDGVCDDGGPGSSYSVCDYGTDCEDCGPRSGTGSSGGTSSGGTSSGGGNGQVTFFTTQDFGCGNISVTFGGYSGTISSYYSSGISNCGASGCANFTLSPGTYTYSASCSGYTWGPGSVTVTSGGCVMFEFY